MSSQKFRKNDLWQRKGYALFASILGITLSIGLVILGQGGISSIQLEDMNPITNSDSNDFTMNIEPKIREPECSEEKCPYSTYDPGDILGYPDFF